MSAPVTDALARSRAVDQVGSVLVQAPAGSGKTTLLTQRYLRLLVTVDAPERILALTFTRRAAHEMRERVIAALRAARAAARPPDMNPRTWELAAAANRHLDGLAVDVAHHPARLRIETIDAFNAWLAGQLPISAALATSARAQDDARFLYEEAARRTLAEEDEELFGPAVERLLELDDQRWSRLRDLIIRMLPGRDRWLPLLAGGLEASAALNEDQLRQVRNRFDQDLALLVSRGLRRALDCLGPERAAALSAQLHRAARRLESGAARVANDGAGFEAWRHDAAVVRSTPQDLPRWRVLVRVVLTQRGTVRSTLTKNEGFAPQCADKPVMLDLLAELGRSPQLVQSLADVAALPEPAYTDAQWERVRGVAQVLMLAAAHLDQVLRERSTADFPAISLAALRALGTPSAPSELVMRLDYRLQHILFDEFQDTSGAQIELLRLLTQGWQAGDGRSVFCVGDPMQSIYGFRQAEVRAFLELAAEGIGELRFDVQRLTSNFRSARPLVQWINATFSRILPDADDPERGAIAYRPSESALPEDPAMEAGVRLRGFAGRATEARAVAGFIAAQTALHPGWRVAVLVRAKSHATPIAAALREAGVPFQAVDIEPLADRPVVRDLVSLLRALLHFGDRTAWLAVLRAPWTGLQLADLLVIARSGGTVWEALADDSVLRRLSEDGGRRCERLRAVLQSALAADRGSITRWLERTWLALGGPAVAANAADLDHARATFARLSQLEARGLPDSARLGDVVADLFVHGGGSCAVEIMTIHKAKGLEFDLVVLPGLDRHVSRHNNPFLVLHSFARAHRDGMVMAARPPVGVSDDALFGYLLRQARDAAALEAQRLLYVGCTRARHQLYLTATLGADEAGDPADVTDGDRASGKEWSPRPGSLLAVLWPGVGAAFEVDTAAVAAARELRGGPLTRLPADWSPPPPPAGIGAEVATEDRMPTPVFDWAGETARQVGTLVHAQLQSMTLDATATTTAAAIRAREAHFRRWLERRGVPRERLHDAAARVSAALIAVQQDPRGRWIMSPGHRDASRELALSGVWRGGLARVVFDRSFIDDGVRWVIDYKTSEHLGSDAEEFLDREVLRYAAQMQRYAALARHLGPEPVRLGLYFPLMRAWREWDPLKT